MSQQTQEPALPPTVPSKLASILLPVGLSLWLLLTAARFYFRLREGQWLSLLADKEIPSFAAGYLKVWAFTRFAGTPFLTGTGIALFIHFGARILGAKRSFIPFWMTYLVLTAAFGLLGDRLPSTTGVLWMLIAAKGAVFLTLVARFYRLSFGQSVGATVLGMTMLGAVMVPYVATKAFKAVWNQSVSSLTGTSLTRVDRPIDPKYTVETLQGEKVRLGDLKGKVVFINFWATWCLPCRVEMPSLQKLHERFRANPNVVFLFISDEEKSVIERYEKDSGYKLPYHIDRGPRPAAFDARGIPATFVISREGRVVAMHEGAARWDTTANIKLLEELAATEPKDADPPSLDALPRTEEEGAAPPDPAAAALHEKASVLMGDGKYREAQKMLDEVFVLRQKSGRQDMEMAATLYALGNAHYHQRHWTVAEAYYKQALLLAQRLQPADDPELGNFYNGLGCAYFSQNRAMEAFVLHEKAIEVAKKRKDKPEQLALFLSNAAKDLHKLNRVEEAREFEKQAAKLKR
jgi:thiol-disulfide isomerase/thioredoxin